jgi:hypothetical protein
MFEKSMTNTNDLTSDKLLDLGQLYIPIIKSAKPSVLWKKFLLCVIANTCFGGDHEPSD